MAKSCPPKVITSIRREINWVAQTAKSADPSDLVNDLMNIDRRLAECSVSGFGGYSRKNRRTRRTRRYSKRRR